MKYCKKCNLIEKKSIEFCQDCGTKLTNVTQKSNLQIINFKDKKIIIGVVIIISILGIYLIKSNVGFSVSLNPEINSNQNVNLKNNAEKSCSTIVEIEEIKIPYLYTYRYSILNSGFNKVTMNATITVKNLESTNGLFTAIAQFRIRGESYIEKLGILNKDIMITQRTVGGALVNLSVVDLVNANSIKIFDIHYDFTNDPGNDMDVDVNLDKYYVIPQIETRYNITFQNKTIEKCN